MKKIYFLLIIALSYSPTKATHIAAGTITYKYISSLTYEVHLILYRDCRISPATAGLGGTASLSITSVNCAQSINLTVDTTGNNTNILIPDMCPSITNWCIDPLSTFPGYEEWHYTGIVTLPMFCDDWVFAYDGCCRNGAINNLNGPGALSYYISAKLNNLTSTGSFNNSAQYVGGAGYVYLINQAYTMNQTAIDPDGDSLVFSLTSPQQIWASSPGPSPCPYFPTGGYSATNPLGTPTATNYANIDPFTGNFNFQNAMQSINVIAINIDEYRNGILVGSTARDLQFSFVNGGPNTLPSLSGVNGTSNYYTSVNVCPGATLNFTVISNDVDVADSVFITPITTLMGSSVFSTNNALQQTGTFSWTPAITDIQPNPYLLVLQAEDNNCHSVSYGYLIYVKPCSSDSVWAGDANDDFTVNNYDVLNIGIANGTSGVARPGATTNWVAAYCPNWTNYFISSVNYKHADCDGNGIVDMNDMNSVSLNYGSIHFKKANPGIYKNRGFPDLYFDASGLTASIGSTLSVPVMLGTNGTPFDSIYGISGRINVNNVLSGPLVLTNSTSWIGNSTNTFFFHKPILSNDLAFTIVRNNQQHINGYGQIATLQIPISPLAINGSKLNLNFTDLRLIDKHGNELTEYNVINDSLTVNYAVQVLNSEFEKQVIIYPNPVKDEICIEFENNSKEKLSHIEICNIMGEVLFVKESPEMIDKVCKLNIKTLTAGSYFIKLWIGDEVLVRKFLK